jgi:hypothetical protein
MAANAEFDTGGTMLPPTASTVARAEPLATVFVPTGPCRAKRESARQSPSADLPGSKVQPLATPKPENACNFASSAVAEFGPMK